MRDRLTGQNECAEGRNGQAGSDTTICAKALPFKMTQVIKYLTQK